jgi:hypothetical protein
MSRGLPEDASGTLRRESIDTVSPDVSLQILGERLTKASGVIADYNNEVNGIDVAIEAMGELAVFYADIQHPPESRFDTDYTIEHLRAERSNREKVATYAAYEYLHLEEEVSDQAADAISIDSDLSSLDEQIIDASIKLEGYTDKVHGIDVAIEAMNDLALFYEEVQRPPESRFDTYSTIELLRAERSKTIEEAVHAVRETLSPTAEVTDDSVEITADTKEEENQASQAEKLKQAEDLSDALIERYDKYGSNGNIVRPEIYSSITQAAANGRLAVARLLREGSNKGLDIAVSYLLPNAQEALKTNVEQRLIKAQKALAKHPLARLTPLWKQEDAGQELVAAKIAITVAQEMALNAQLAGVQGAPEVAPPRLFRTPETRGANDFKEGDEVLCTPYIKHRNVVGLSRGRVVEVKTGGKKGPRVIVEVDKFSGIKTQYSRGVGDRHLIHDACWRAFRHSAALRSSWQKVTNTSLDTMWPPLAPTL